MNTKDFFKKYQIVLLLSFIVVALSMIKMVWGYKGDLPKKELEQVTPTLSPAPTGLELNEDNYPLWNLLPYKGKNFTVEQYKAPLSLTVTTSEEKQLLAKEEFDNWFNSFEKNLDQHQIEWVLLP